MDSDASAVTPLRLIHVHRSPMSVKNGSTACMYGAGAVDEWRSITPSWEKAL